MNIAEIEFLKSKLAEKQKFIRSQHCLPKPERNQKQLQNAIKSSEVINRWLKEN